jgi:hypothetical protein
LKKILIVESELNIQPPNKRIILKKNKTIIKDRNYFDDPVFVSTLSDHDYNFYLEEWEVVSDEKVQVIMSNNGKQLRPVHIIDSTRPSNGVKALFQSEKMVVFKLTDNSWELVKNFVSSTGEIETSVLFMDDFKSFTDIKRQVDPKFLPVIEQVESKSEEYKNSSYMAPLWAQID